MWEIALLVFVGSAAWFWMSSLRAREQAVEAGRDACGRYGVQLLDDTVAIATLGFARDEEGVLRLRRTYAFEFSATGHNRRQGTIHMLGPVVSDVHFEPYEA